MCHSCSVFVVAATAFSLFRKYSCPCLSKLKCVPPETNFPVPFLNMTSAPQSVAARTEKRLVGNVGAKSAFFNVTFRDIPLESKI